MIQINYKKSLISIIILSCLMILIGLWFGAKNKFVYSDFSFDPKSADELIMRLEKEQKENQFSLENRFNLSVLIYKNGNFEKSKESLQKLLNSGTNDSNLLISGFYNLGNTFFKIAETEKEIEKAIELYQKSLTSYRGALELIDRDRKFSKNSTKNNKDILHNFILAKNRIKILADQLKTNKQAEKQQQSPYQLIKQIETNESSIKSLVNNLQQTDDVREILEFREEILKLRKENLDNLAIIKKQVVEQGNQNSKQPSPQSISPNSSNKLTI